MKILIQKGKAIQTSPESITQPLGIEYEELARNIHKQQNFEDLRTTKYSLDMMNNENNDQKTLLLIPGSAIVNYENTQHDTAPRPQEGPSRASDCWIGK